MVAARIAAARTVASLSSGKEPFAEQPPPLASERCTHGSRQGIHSLQVPKGLC